MDLNKQTTSRFYTGQGTSTTTAASLLSAGMSLPVYKKVTVRAGASNTDSIYVGRSGVTTATGYVLSASQSIDIWAEDPADIFVVSASNQSYSWIAA